MRGEVKWFGIDKGYGFIAPEGGGKDVFVHISELQKANIPLLKEGDKVEFEVAIGKNGRSQAGNVILI